MEAKLVHLYDLGFKGCTSRFGCTRIGGAGYGRCAMRDDLTPLLDEIHGDDVLVLGMPVYFGGETGMTRCFLERAAFPYFTYTNPPGTLFPRRIRTVVLYTMGMPEEGMPTMGYAYFMEQTIRFPNATTYFRWPREPSRRRNRSSGTASASPPNLATKATT